MSSSHSRMVKDSLDRPVRLKDIKHCSVVFSVNSEDLTFLFFFKKMMDEIKKAEMKRETEDKWLRM